MCSSALLTGVLRQPSFAVRNLMRMMRLLVGQWFVSFANSDPSRSVLRRAKKQDMKHKSSQSKPTQTIQWAWGPFLEPTLWFRHKQNINRRDFFNRGKKRNAWLCLPCSRPPSHGGFCFPRIWTERWSGPAQPGEREDGCHRNACKVFMTQTQR